MVEKVANVQNEGLVPLKLARNSLPMAMVSMVHLRVSVAGISLMCKKL